MNEIAIAYEWIYTQLADDATLAAIPIGGVFRSIAKDGTSTPYVIVSHLGGHDVLGSGGARIMSDLLFQVYAIGPAANFDDVSLAALRIDALLESQAGTNDDGTVLAIRRQQPLILDEIVNAAMWTRLGGIYRVWVNQP
jgi:hypothetical protein